MAKGCSIIIGVGVLSRFPFSPDKGDEKMRPYKEFYEFSLGP
jgi:hypothetical protein